MSFGTSRNPMGVRERTAVPPAPRTVQCSQCGASNPGTMPRCRDCFAPLAPPNPAPPGPRTPSLNADARQRQIETILEALEEIARDDEPPAAQFQCPECHRLVDERAILCRCGAVFESADDILGYECPLCGARVPEDATACACGARFAP